MMESFDRREGLLMKELKTCFSNF